MWGLGFRGLGFRVWVELEWIVLENLSIAQIKTQSQVDSRLRDPTHPSADFREPLVLRRFQS